MKNTDCDRILGNLAEMHLIVEGALSIYEKSDGMNTETFELVGAALYLIRDKITECKEINRTAESYGGIGQ